MIELYGRGSPNALKITIMLEACGIPYQLHYVDVLGGEQYDPHFLAISPNNKIPAIVDTEGPGGAAFSVFESGAILIYLAEKTGCLLPADSAGRSTVLQWLMLQMASVGPMFGQRGHFAVYAPAGNDYSDARYASEAARIMGVLDGRLEQSPHLGGCALSIADVATYPWIRTALNVFPELRGGVGRLAGYPHLKRWFEALSQHPAVSRGIEAMADWTELDKARRAAATPDDYDRFLKRGLHASRFDHSDGGAKPEPSERTS